MMEPPEALAMAGQMNAELRRRRPLLLLPEPPAASPRMLASLDGR